jgi:hypothetical protein
MKKVSLIFLVSFLITASVLQAQWKPANGPLGYVSCIAQIPNSTGGTNLFVGDTSGVYLSTDNGATWTNRGFNNYYVPFLVVINNNIFAATVRLNPNPTNGALPDSGRIFLSTDNGASWNEADSGLAKNYISSFFACPTKTGGYNLYAVESNGLFLSTNNGTSWALIDTVYYYPVKPIPDGNGGYDLIAGTTGHILLSSNSGESWTSIHNYSHSGKAARFYIFGTKILAQLEHGCFLSTDYGKNWDSTNLNIDLSYFNANYIESRTNSGDTIDIIASWYGTFISKDNAKSWTNVNSDLPFLDITSLIAIPNGSGGDNIYAGATNGDVYLSTDNGNSWNAASYCLASDRVVSICSSSPIGAKSTGMNGTYLYAAVVHGGSNRPVVNNLLVSTNGGTRWSTISIGLHNSYVNSLASSLDASGINTVYAGTYYGLYSSTNNGTSWTADTNGLSTEINSIAFSNNSTGGSNIFVNIGSGIFLSTDNGGSWNSVSSNLKINPGEYINSLAVSPNNTGGNNIFAGTTKGSVYLSADIGINWSCISDSISQYIIDSFTANTNTTGGTDLYAWTYYKGMFFSSDFGKNWTLLNKHSYKAKIYGIDNNLFSVSPEDDIYLSTDNGTSWKDVSGNLPNTDITSLVLADNNLYASVWGSGIWWRPLSELLTPVKDKQNNLPINYSLQQNYPNPFNPSTVIEYQLPKSSFVTLKVYDVLGREVRTLFNGYKTLGKYSVSFDASNYASGVYFYRLKSDGYSSIKKMILMK